MNEAVSESQHRTVLLHEAVDALAIDADANGGGQRRHGVYVDGTFGRGGHSRAILQRLGAHGRLIAFDKDPQAVAAARGIDDPRFAIVHDSFAGMGGHLARAGVKQVQGVLLDLGVSSPQIDEAARGFSFRLDGPLDMRMDPTRGMSAAAWLANATMEELRGVIRDYGEERFALQIAKAIVARRAERPIETTRELAALVAGAVRTRGKKDAGQDPATRTFQAIRIHINQELAELEQGLAQAMDALAPGGRLVVIAFHSLEDRIVKRFMFRHAHPESAPDAPPARLPLRADQLPLPRLALLGKVVPGAAEVAANPRARSAIMRVAVKLGAKAQA